MSFGGEGCPYASTPMYIYSSHKKFAECGFAQHAMVTLDKGSMSVMYNQSQSQPVCDTNTSIYNVKLGEKAIIQCDSYRTKLKYLTIDYERWHLLLSIYLHIPGQMTCGWT